MRLTPIEKLSKISTRNFNTHYMKPRLPVVMEDFIDPESPAFKKWSYEYFKEIAGDHKVNIYGSELESLDRVASSPIGQTTFSEYLDLISTTPTEHRLFYLISSISDPSLKMIFTTTMSPTANSSNGCLLCSLVVKVRSPEIILISICPMCLLPSFTVLKESGFSHGSSRI